MGKSLEVISVGSRRDYLSCFFSLPFSSKNNYKRLFIEEPQRLLLSLQAVKVESKLNGLGKC